MGIDRGLLRLVLGFSERWSEQTYATEQVWLNVEVNVGIAVVDHVEHLYALSVLLVY